jgi:hypothetical protein
MAATNRRRLELVFDVASDHPSGTLAVRRAETVAFESWAELFSLLDEALERLHHEASPPPIQGEGT